MNKTYYKEYTKKNGEISKYSFDVEVKDINSSRTKYFVKDEEKEQMRQKYTTGVTKLRIQKEYGISYFVLQKILSN